MVEQGSGLESRLMPINASVERVKVEMVQISLTPEQQALFASFQRQQKNLACILQSGALDIRNGTFVCHLDNDGNIRKIDRQDRLYSS